MTLSQKRRIEKIEQKLKIEKDTYGKLPDGKGGFIEVPGHLSFLDFMAMCDGLRDDKKPDETERNRTVQGENYV